MYKEYPLLPFFVYGRYPLGEGVAEGVPPEVTGGAKGEGWKKKNGSFYNFFFYIKKNV